VLEGFAFVREMAEETASWQPPVGVTETARSTSSATRMENASVKHLTSWWVTTA